MARKRKTLSKLGLLVVNIRGMTTDGTNGPKMDLIMRHNQDIKIIIDCHLKSTEIIKYQQKYRNWNFHLSTNESGNSRGIMIMTRKSMELQEQIVKNDDNGNYILLKITHDRSDILLSAIYGPGTDEPQFYEDVLNKIDNTGIVNKIICGDFNLTLDPTLETWNYIGTQNNKNAREVLKRYVRTNDMEDPLHFSNYMEPHFTWCKDNGEKMARLDRFLLSPALAQHSSHYHRLTRETGYDHHPISLDIDFSNFTPGAGLWRLPTI